MVLRARDIDNLVLVGIATSGVVLYTLCQANDPDFGLTVLVDACPDTDPETAPARRRIAPVRRIRA